MILAIWIIAICILLQTLYRINMVILEWLSLRYPYGTAPRWAKMWASITTGVRIL